MLKRTSLINPIIQKDITTSIIPTSEIYLIETDGTDQEITLRKLREQYQLIRNAPLVKQVKSLNN